MLISFTPVCYEDLYACTYRFILWPHAWNCCHVLLKDFFAPTSRSQPLEHRVGIRSSGFIEWFGMSWSAQSFFHVETFPERVEWTKEYASTTGKLFLFRPPIVRRLLLTSVTERSILVREILKPGSATPVETKKEGISSWTRGDHRVGHPAPSEVLSSRSNGYWLRHPY